MNDNTKKIRLFTDLNTWKEAHKLVLMIYKATKDFPKEEMFGLTSQIRRAVVSITSNIAEGFSRQTYKDKVHFYFMARGSLTEIQNQLLIAKDLDYINNGNFDSIANQTVVVHKLLNGLIKKSKDIQNSKFKIQNSNNNGFTFIEMLIAITILVIMAVAISAFFTNLYKEQNSDVARIKRVDVAGKVIEIMSTEIRKMNRAESGIYPLEIIQGQTLIFYSDVDNDGLTERVEYSLNETTLEKKLIEPGEDLNYLGEETTTIIAEGIRNGTNPLFKYYDENYTGSGDSLAEPINITNVKIIEIILDLNTDEKYLTNPLRIETKVHPRNLKNFN